MIVRCMFVGVVVIVLEVIATVLGLLLQKKKPKPHTDNRANVVCVAVNDCDTATADNEEVEASGDERSRRQDTTFANIASAIEESGDNCISKQR